MSDDNAGSCWSKTGVTANTWTKRKAVLDAIDAAQEARAAGGDAEVWLLLLTLGVALAASSLFDFVEAFYHRPRLPARGTVRRADAAAFTHRTEAPNMHRLAHDRSVDLCRGAGGVRRRDYADFVLGLLALKLGVPTASMARGRNTRQVNTCGRSTGRAVLNRQCAAPSWGSLPGGHSNGR